MPSFSQQGHGSLGGLQRAFSLFPCIVNRWYGLQGTVPLKFWIQVLGPIMAPVAGNGGREFWGNRLEPDSCVLGHAGVPRRVCVREAWSLGACQCP